MYFICYIREILSGMMPVFSLQTKTLKMKKAFFYLPALASLMFAACSNNGDAVNETPVESASQEVVAPISSTPVLTDSVSTETPQEVNLSAPEASAPASGSDVALNPPHGQPGHRCEIPVGAPLDGSAAAAPQAAPQGVTTPTPIFNNQSSDVKINPPHGQPGHSCAVPVGSPLPG